MADPQPEYVPPPVLAKVGLRPLPAAVLTEGKQKSNTGTARVPPQAAGYCRLVVLCLPVKLALPLSKNVVSPGMQILCPCTEILQLLTEAHVLFGRLHIQDWLVLM